MGTLLLHRILHASQPMLLHVNRVGRGWGEPRGGGGERQGQTELVTGSSSTAG